MHQFRFNIILLTIYYYDVISAAAAANNENPRKINTDLTAGIVSGSASVNNAAENANLLVTNQKSVNIANASIISENHICTREENYVEELRTPSMEPVRIRSSTWCLEFPPRCSSYRTEMREMVTIEVGLSKITKVHYIKNK